MLRDFDRAAECARKALGEMPSNIRAHHRLACSLGHKGDEKAARAALQESKDIMPQVTLEFIDATYPFTNPDDREFFIEGLRKAGWEG